MALPSIDPSADPSLDLTRSEARSRALRAERGSTRSRRPSPSSPGAATETVPETAVEQHQQISENSNAPASAPGTRARPSEGPVTAPGARTDRPAPKAHGSAPKSKRPVPKLVLDVKAVADVAGLEQEVAVLRASIRQLANNGDMDVHVKVLAELRHQIEALCRALKTQQSLEGPDGDGRAAEMRRVLEELGDDLGVAR